MKKLKEFLATGIINKSKLAKNLGISKGYLSQILSGDTKITQSKREYHIELIKNKVYDIGIKAIEVL